LVFAHCVQIIRNALGLLIGRHVGHVAHSIEGVFRVRIEWSEQRVEVVRYETVLATSSNVLRSAWSEPRLCTSTSAIWQDPSEKNDVAATNPDKVATLQKRANEVAATMAKPLRLEAEFDAMRKRLHMPPALPGEESSFNEDD
jgi:hypothetical protein